MILAGFSSAFSRGMTAYLTTLKYTPVVMSSHPMVIKVMLNHNLISPGDFNNKGVYG